MVSYESSFLHGAVFIGQTLSRAVDYTIIWTGIEAVITALTRNFPTNHPFRPQEIQCLCGFFVTRKLNISEFSPVVLS